MARRVTLKQVAAQAGVSYQTVSKVLNRQVRVSKSTEMRIFEAAHELGYRPNHIARSLRSQRSNLIGYSWAPAPPGQANFILDQFLQSMTCAAESAGHHILVFPHHPRDQWIEAYRELIDTNRVDGFVISSVEYNDTRIPFLEERKYPFIAFGRSNPDWEFPYVDVDGGAGMGSVVEHLVSLGHRSIAVLAWPEDSRVGNNRMEGLLEAAGRAGISFPDGWIMRGEGNHAFGYETTRRWLNLADGKRPTAVIAFNDEMAIGALHAAQARGVQVGTGLAITGFDDAPMAQYITPSLTTVRQPIEQVGAKLMEILLQILEGEKPAQSQILIQPRLVIRESTVP